MTALTTQSHSATSALPPRPLRTPTPTARIDAEDLMRIVVGDADRSREHLARHLGVSVHTLDAWLKPSRETAMPFWAAFELLGWVSTRRVLIDALCERAGGVFVADIEAGADRQPVERQVLEIAERFGEVSGTVRAAIDDGVVDDRERRAIEARLVDMQREIAAMLEGMK